MNKPIQNTDEYWMERLDALIEKERSLALDGMEDSQEIIEVHAEALAIYNDLQNRGWVWSDRENEWVRKDE